MFYRLFIILILSLVTVHCQDLFQAIKSGDEATVLKILNEYTPNMRNSQDPKSKTINRPGLGGQTPLMFSVLNGYVWAVKVLLEHGANVNIGEQDGYTPMHGAGFQGRAEIAQILADHGVSMTDKHRDGFTPFHRACWGTDRRHTETVEVFLKNGVDADIESDDGRTCGAMTTNPHTKALLERLQQEL